MSRRKETKYIIVDSTNTKPSIDLCVRDIDERDRKEGKLKIGNHYLIKRDGTIELGRPVTEIGAHFQELDANSVSILLVGGLNTRGIEAPDYTKDQQKSLFVLLRSLTFIYRDAIVIGRKCVGYDVESWWTENMNTKFNFRDVYNGN